jgi:predicted PurR-regulated permease PerM
VIQPVVYGQAIELSGFATIAVVMVGGALMGVIGAILAVPVAGSLKVIFREVMASRMERMDALRAQPADEVSPP